MLRIETGARLVTIEPQIVAAMAVVASAFDRLGYDCVVAAGVEGEGSSLLGAHCAGHALDFSLNHLPFWLRDEAVEQSTHSLGEEFFVCLSMDDARGTIMHVGYTPSAGMTHEAR